MAIARENMASGVSNDMIYVVGGDNAYYRALDTTSEYDPANDAWKTKTPMPSGVISPLVSLLAADVANGKLYVIGGLVTYEYTPSNDIL
jgi:N-acetylneuraminic acid mutarotase